MHNFTGGTAPGGDAWLLAACACGAVDWASAGPGSMDDREVIEKTKEYVAERGIYTVDQLFPDRTAKPSEQAIKKAIADALELKDAALAAPDLALWSIPKNVGLLKFVHDFAQQTYFQIMAAWKSKLPTTKIEKLVEGEIKKDRKSGSDKRDRSPAQLVMDAIEEAGYELWHTQDGMGYITIDGRHVIIGTSEFNAFITTMYHDETHDVLSANALRSVAATLDGYATRFGSPEYEIDTRVARRGETIYVDMANEKGEVIAVTKDGWKIQTGSPVRFRRPKGMLPLPYPVDGGSLEEIKTVTNIVDDQFILVKAWLIGTLNPVGSYPVLVFVSPGGRVKSRTCARLKKVIDPAFTELESLPTKKESDDALIIAALDNLAISFDNVSYISPEMSDRLCKISSGAGFRRRKFYTNAESVQFVLKKPMIINGINESVTKGDLLDRSIFIESPLPTFKATADAESEFTEMHPKLLGALLNYAVAGLKAMAAGDVPAGCNTRMTDFAQWVVLCLGPEEGKKFTKVYSENKDAQIDSVSEGNPVVETLRMFMKTKGNESSWTGTASELLISLERQGGYKSGYAPRPEGWPANPRSLSSKLNELDSQIRKRGLVVTRHRGTERKITVDHIPGFCEPDDALNKKVFADPTTNLDDHE